MLGGGGGGGGLGSNKNLSIERLGTRLLNNNVAFVTKAGDKHGILTHRYSDKLSITQLLVTIEYSSCERERVFNASASSHTTTFLEPWQQQQV